MSTPIPLLQLMPRFRYINSREAVAIQNLSSANLTKWSAIFHNTFLVLLLDSAGQLQKFQLIKPQKADSIHQSAYIIPLYSHQTDDGQRLGNFHSQNMEKFLEPIQICYFFNDHRGLDGPIPDAYVVSSDMLSYIVAHLNRLAPRQTFLQPSSIDQLTIPLPSADSIEKSIYQGRRLVGQLRDRTVP